jgi:hypothetical protein
MMHSSEKIPARRRARKTLIYNDLTTEYTSVVGSAHRAHDVCLDVRQVLTRLEQNATGWVLHQDILLTQ